MIVGSQFGAGIGPHGNISGLDRSTATHSHVDLVHRTPTYWRPSDHRERIEAGYPPTTATLRILASGPPWASTIWLPLFGSMRISLSPTRSTACGACFSCVAGSSVTPCPHPKEPQ
jgi:hypothetical protein